jgi:hypothetical protein
MLQRGHIRKWGEFDKGCRTIALDVERDDAALVDVEVSDQAVGPPKDVDAEMSKLSSTERPGSLDVADDGPFQTIEALEVREEGQSGRSQPEHSSGSTRVICCTSGARRRRLS